MLWRHKYADQAAVTEGSSYFKFAFIQDCFSLETLAKVPTSDFDNIHDACQEFEKVSHWIQPIGNYGRKIR